MNSQRRSNFVLFSLLFVAMTAGAMFAQDDNYPAPAPPSATVTQDNPGQSAQQDPSGRVARVQYMSGQVSMQPGGVNDWIAASQNRPLTTADRVWTDKNSQAELNVGDGYIRMNSETSLTLSNVSDQNVQMELDQGALELTVRHLEPGEIYEVDTPNYAFTVMKTGVYRFDVYPNEDQSWVTVRSGYGQATGTGNAVRVNSGTQVRFSGGNSLQHVSENAPARDGFDDWVQVRDKRLDSSASAQYVSPGVIGYQDLDGYGRWVPTPSYGSVWIPSSVPVGWAPYRFGHWVWIAPWGWTWVDDQPWGFAPFHYGRWVSWGGGWAWAPGPRNYWRPYYAPALVGWVGGSGISVGFSFGGIGVGFGWFPLGWGEPYYPYYSGWGHGGWYNRGGYVSNNYFRNVNITNTHITNITNITNNYYSGNVGQTRYGFRSAPNAVTAAPRSAFASGAAINRVGGAVPKADLGRASLVRGVAVTPTRESMLGGRAPETRGVPPASAFSRTVVTNNRPPATRPANLQTANEATNARGNLNTPNGRPATAAGAARPPITGAANNPRVNDSANAPGKSTEVVRGPVNNGTPTSGGGRYVPRPPSAGGNAVTPNESRGTVQTATPPRNVPRPPATETYSRPNTGVDREPVSSNPHVSNPNVARPPQTYEPNRGATPRMENPSPSVQPSRPVVTTPHQSEPKASPRNTPHGGNGSEGPGTAMSVPRPPATYAYRAPASSSFAGNNADSGASATRTYTPVQSYSAPRSTPSSAPSRSYISAPARPAAPAYQVSRGSSSPSYSSRMPSSARAAGSASRAPAGGGGSARAVAHTSASRGGGEHHGR